MDSLPIVISRSTLPGRVVLVLAACGGLLVACSSNDESATTSTSAPTTVATTVTTTVNMVVTTVAATLDPELVEAVVDFTVSKGAEEGFAFDPDCVAGYVDQLSTDDLEALYVPTLDSVPGAVYPVLSPTGVEIAEQLTTCLTSQGGDPALVDQVVQVLLASGDGPNLDQECVRRQVETLNDAQLNAVLTAEAGSADPDLARALGAVFVCLVQVDAG